MLVSGTYCRFYDGISVYGEGVARKSDRWLYEREDAPFVRQDERTSGSSASNFGGGSQDYDLPKIFYKSRTKENFAENSWKTCSSAIMESEILERFLAKAKEKEGYIL